MTTAQWLRTPIRPTMTQTELETCVDVVAAEELIEKKSRVTLGDQLPHDEKEKAKGDKTSAKAKAKARAGGGAAAEDERCLRRV